MTIEDIFQHYGPTVTVAIAAYLVIRLVLANQAKSLDIAEKLTEMIGRVNVKADKSDTLLAMATQSQNISASNQTKLTDLIASQGKEFNAALDSYIKGREQNTANLLAAIDRTPQLITTPLLTAIAELEKNFTTLQSSISNNSLGQGTILSQAQTISDQLKRIETFLLNTATSVTISLPPQNNANNAADLSLPSKDTDKS